MKIEVKDGIPIPPRYSSGRKRLYPFDKMAIGNHFDIPNENKNSQRVNLRQSAKALNMTIRTEVVGVAGELIRVWRVS